MDDREWHGGHVLEHQAARSHGRGLPGFGKLRAARAMTVGQHCGNKALLEMVKMDPHLDPEGRGCGGQGAFPRGHEGGTLHCRSPLADHACQMGLAQALHVLAIGVIARFRLHRTGGRAIALALCPVTHTAILLV